MFPVPQNTMLGRRLARQKPSKKKTTKHIDAATFNIVTWGVGMFIKGGGTAIKFVARRI